MNAILAAGLLVVMLAGAAAAQGASPSAVDGVDPALGRGLAQRWCAECHVITPAPPARPPLHGAPSFTAVANDPTTSELGLRVFLQTPHARMPNIRLDRDQIGQLSAYILSLRSR